MGAELIVLGAIGIVIAAAAAAATWETVQNRRFLRWTAAHWVEQGWKSIHDPVIAVYYGDEPRRSYVGVETIPGALGIANQFLVFTQRETGQEQRLPLDLIQWVGTHTVELRTERATIEREALVVHYEDRGLWCMGVWVMAWAQGIAAAISKNTGLPDHKCYDSRDDYGPENCLCLVQDIYGTWLPASEVSYPDGEPETPYSTLRSTSSISRGSLYLAPDRLLFSRRHALHLSQIRGVAIYEGGGLLHDLNPFAEDLLRIEYEMPDDPQRHVVGFQVQHAEQWGTLLAQRTQVPFDVREGRKKKA